MLVERVVPNRVSITHSYVLSIRAVHAPLPLGDSAALKAAEETAGHVLGDLKMEFGTKEPSLSVRVRGTEEPAELCLGKGATHRLLSLLDLLPHGVMKISHDVEGLVRSQTGPLGFVVGPMACLSLRLSRELPGFLGKCFFFFCGGVFFIFLVGKGAGCARAGARAS